MTNLPPPCLDWLSLIVALVVCFFCWKSSWLVRLNRYWQNLIKSGMAVVLKHAYMTSALDNIRLVCTVQIKVDACPFIFALKMRLIKVAQNLPHREKLYTHDDRHIKLFLSFVRWSHPSCMRAIISLTGYSITSCCVRTSEGPGWSDLHHITHRTGRDRDCYPGRS